MSDVIWETFDGLFKTLHRQGRRVEELEARVVELERRLNERFGKPTPPQEMRCDEPVPETKAEPGTAGYSERAERSDSLAD